MKSNTAIRHRSKNARFVNDFNLMVRKGKLTTEQTSCLCGSRRQRPVSQYDFYGLWNPVVICRQCGLIYASPRLTEKSYEWFYSSDTYRLLYSGADYGEKSEKKYASDFSRHIFSQIDPEAKNRGMSKIVEIGCGGGWNLVNFFQNSYEVSGYDLGPTLVEVGRAKGLDLHVGSLADLQGQYDIIIMNHVLEHFVDPLGAVSGAIRHLRPAGLLYIGVPNMDNFHEGQLQNAHTYYFTPRTLLHYLTPLGLRAIRTGPAEGEHFFALFETNQSMGPVPSISGEYGRMVRLIHRYRIRRAMVAVLNKLGLKQQVKDMLKDFVSKQ